MTEWNSELRQACTAVQQWIKSVVANQPTTRLFFLSGKSGCGKTHLAKRCAHFTRAAGITALEKGWWPSVPSVSFVAWAEFIDSGSDGVERDARESDFTILDDVGSESDQFKSGAAKDKICQLLSARENKFTMVTSNISFSEWAKIDARIADRLLRNSESFEFRDTPSWSAVGQSQVANTHNQIR